MRGSVKQKLSVPNKSTVLGVVTLNVVMMSVVMPSATAPSKATSNFPSLFRRHNFPIQRGGMGEEGLGKPYPPPPPLPFIFNAFLQMTLPIVNPVAINLIANKFGITLKKLYFGLYFLIPCLLMPVAVANRK